MEKTRSVSKKMYLKELKEYSIIPNEQQVEYVLLAQKRNSNDPITSAKAENALNKLIEGYQEAVIGIANKLMFKMDMDAIQAGNMGLFEAVMKYNPKKGASFYTYATKQIEFAVLKHIYDNTKFIVVPEEYHKEHAKIKRFISEYSNKHGMNPSIAEIAHNTNLTEERIKTVILSMRDVTSLDRKVDDEDDESCELGDLIPNDDVEDALSKLISDERFKVAMEVVDTFPRLHRYIFLSYHGLMLEKKNYSELEAELQIRRQTIQYKYDAVLNAIRAKLCN